jgi:hydroxylamine reductase (hybrid-cluster protein)
MSIAAYAERDQSRVEIPVSPVDVYTGFSNEALLHILGGSLEPLLDAIKNGSIRGVVAITKIYHDGIFRCNRRSIVSQAARVRVAEPIPNNPRIRTASCQPREINHIEEAPVIKNIKIISDDADPTSCSTCSRIRLLPGGLPKAKKKVRNHIGNANRKGCGIRVKSIGTEAMITPR